MAEPNLWMILIFWKPPRLCKYISFLIWRFKDQFWGQRNPFCTYDHYPQLFSLIHPPLRFFCDGDRTCNQKWPRSRYLCSNLLQKVPHICRLRTTDHQKDSKSFLRPISEICLAIRHLKWSLWNALTQLKLISVESKLFIRINKRH